MQSSISTVTFPEEGKGARDGAGWHVCLDRLTVASPGTDLPGASADHWRVMHRAYVDPLGPEASVIGPPSDWEGPGTP